MGPLRGACSSAPWISTEESSKRSHVPCRTVHRLALRFRARVQGQGRQAYRGPRSIWTHWEAIPFSRTIDNAPLDPSPTNRPLDRCLGSLTSSVPKTGSRWGSAEGEHVMAH